MGPIPFCRRTFSSVKVSSGMSSKPRFLLMSAQCRSRMPGFLHEGEGASQEGREEGSGGGGGGGPHRVARVACLLWSGVCVSCVLLGACVVVVVVCETGAADLRATTSGTCGLKSNTCRLISAAMAAPARTAKVTAPSPP